MYYLAHPDSGALYIKKNQVCGLTKCDCLNWWKQTKRITGQEAKCDLTRLANLHCDGNVNVRTLANTIDKSLQSVSNDLPPLPAVCPIQVNEVPDAYVFKPRDIKIHKVAGPDDQPNWFLHGFAALLCDPLCNIFNASLREGFVPSIWKEANVIPIPKSSSPNSIKLDLRPISLTAT